MNSHWILLYEDLIILVWKHFHWILLHGVLIISDLRELSLNIVIWSLNHISFERTHWILLYIWSLNHISFERTHWILLYGIFISVLRELSLNLVIWCLNHIRLERTLIEYCYMEIYIQNWLSLSLLIQIMLGRNAQRGQYWKYSNILWDLSVHFECYHLISQNVCKLLIAKENMRKTYLLL